MDEEIKEASKKISRKKIREEQEKKQRHFADKLKTYEDKRAYTGEKLRSGKKDTAETRAELLENTRVKKQSRAKALKKTYEIAQEAKRRVVYSSSPDSTQGNNEDVSVHLVDEVYAESKDLSAYILHQVKKRYSNKLHNKERLASIQNPTANTISLKKENAFGEKVINGTYSPKMWKATDLENSDLNETSRKIQKLSLKKKMQREGYEANMAKKGTQTLETTRIGDSIKAFFNNMEQKVTELVAENPIGAVFAVVGLIIVLVTCSMISSCSLLGGGSGDVSIATTFTAHDEDILDTEDDYIELEEELQEFIDDYEINNPGYDEYKYELDEIGHNPFALAALLTVLYEDYTEAEVQEMLNVIFELQYVITETESSETRTKTVLNEETGEYEEVEYEARIMTVSVTNNSINEVVAGIGLDEDEMARYELLLETYGNKKYLFEDDIYAVIDRGTFGNYRIPSEHLTDAEFAKLIHEAEKYLGMEYVWGGSKPSTGFDCSGFVSYVLNHSGNGIDVGRPTANGLANMCAQVSRSEAKPGDLIFFKNTYAGAPNGASHVGIYVGDGMMIHCGNPVQYTSIETPFWQNHLYGYGRIENEE